MQNPIIAALDIQTAEQALKLAQELAPAVGAFKIGKELFTSAGPDIVKRVRDTGASVFLDLKFHDIPNTVAKAIASAVRLDVQMVTIHTSGGSEMMRAAEQSAQQTASQSGRNAPLVLGVTVLTSHDASTLAEIGCEPNVGKQVERLAGQVCVGWSAPRWKLPRCGRCFPLPCNWSPPASAPVRKRRMIRSARSPRARRCRPVRAGW